MATFSTRAPCCTSCSKQVYMNSFMGTPSARAGAPVRKCRTNEDGGRACSTRARSESCWPRSPARMVSSMLVRSRLSIRAMPANPATERITATGGDGRARKMEREYIIAIVDRRALLIRPSATKLYLELYSCTYLTPTPMHGNVSRTSRKTST